MGDPITWIHSSPGSKSITHIYSSKRKEKSRQNTNLKGSFIQRLNCKYYDHNFPLIHLFLPLLILEYLVNTLNFLKHITVFPSELF